MESRIGWHRAMIAAEAHDVTVLCGPDTCVEVLREAAELAGKAEHVQFHAVDPGWLSKSLSKSATTYYIGYRLWHNAAFRLAKQLHSECSFDLVHQTSFCGFREPGLCWKLGVPFVWGPVGGTQSFPFRYLTQLSPRRAWIEVCRNLINAWQIRFSWRVRSAAKRSAVVIAATRRAQEDLRRSLGVESSVQIETALDFPVGKPRPVRDPSEPLRILWAGRLRAWKTLPLLLKALAQLPPTLKYEVRVLGIGSSQPAWARLTERLGISDRIEWLGWPEYQETLPHYRWADAFAFTSMRDTSGTGLHESLAMGTPIIGVDHQGAADIMTDECALRVPVASPKETIRAFADALVLLAEDPAQWKRLSDGALAESQHCTWKNQTDVMLRWYEEAMLSAGRERSASNTRTQDQGSSIAWRDLDTNQDRKIQVTSAS